MLKKIEVIGKEIEIVQNKKEDYISITDIAKYKNPDASANISYKLVTEQKYN